MARSASVSLVTNSGGLSPMNFRVTCRDSMGTQRTSGGNPRRPSMNPANRSRMASSISRAIKSLTIPQLSTGSYRLHQLSAHHIERELGREPAHAFAIAGELALFHLRAIFTGKSVVDKPHGLFFRSAQGAGHARDTDPKRRLTALADALGQGGCDLAAYGAMLRDQTGGNVGEFGFEFIRVHHGSAHEVARTAADGGDPLSQQAAGAGLGGGQRGSPHSQVITNDLLKRLALRGVDGIFEFVFDVARQFIDPLLGLFHRSGAGEQVEFHIA